MSLDFEAIPYSVITNFGKETHIWIICVPALSIFPLGMSNTGPARSEIQIGKAIICTF